MGPIDSKVISSRKIGFLCNLQNNTRTKSIRKCMHNVVQKHQFMKHYPNKMHNIIIMSFSLAGYLTTVVSYILGSYYFQGFICITWKYVKSIIFRGHTTLFATNDNEFKLCLPHVLLFIWFKYNNRDIISS